MKRKFPFEGTFSFIRSKIGAKQRRYPAEGSSAEGSSAEGTLVFPSLLRRGAHRAGWSEDESLRRRWAAW